MHIPHPTPLDSTEVKLQKPPKESGLFQSLGTVSIVLFSKRLSPKSVGGMAQCPP